MASAVDAVVDEGKALGGVVDKYFSFIYEEPTDDALSDVEESVIDSAVDHGSSMEDTVVTSHPDDPISQNSRHEDAQTADSVIRPQSTDLETEQGGENVTEYVDCLKSENFHGSSPEDGDITSRHDLGSREILDVDAVTASCGNDRLESYRNNIGTLDLGSQDTLDVDAVAASCGDGSLESYRNDTVTLEGYENEAEIMCLDFPDQFGAIPAAGAAVKLPSTTLTITAAAADQPQEKLKVNPFLSPQLNPHLSFQLNPHSNSELNFPSNVNLNPESNMSSSSGAEPQHWRSLTSGSSSLEVTSKPEVCEWSPGPQHNTVTPILLLDNSHSIYVSGDAHERNPRATSVYLNANQDRSSSYIVPPCDSASAVTIKITPDDDRSLDNVLGESEGILVNKVDPEAFGNFLEEMQKPYTCVEFGKCEDDGATVNLLEEMHKPFVTGDFGEVDRSGGARYDSFSACEDRSVLDIGAIECDILDELFEGIIKNEAKFTLLRPEDLVHDDKTGVEEGEGKCGSKGNVDDSEFELQKQDKGACESEMIREDPLSIVRESDHISLEFTEPVSSSRPHTPEATFVEGGGQEAPEQRQQDVECESAIGDRSCTEDNDQSLIGGWGKEPVAPALAIESDDVSATGNSDHENTAGEHGAPCSYTCEGQGSTAEQRPTFLCDEDDPAYSRSFTQDQPICTEAASAAASNMTAPSGQPNLATPSAACSESEDCSWHEIGAVGGAGIWRPDQLDATSDVCDFDADCESAEDSKTGLAAAVSRIVRRSMRRMRRLRLSGRGSPRRSHCGSEDTIGVSEETELRRSLPSAPPVGLSTVRSPAAASIIVTSLMAALAPPPLYAPRETLDPPPGDARTPSNPEDTTAPEGIWGRQQRSRHRRGASMGRLHPPMEPAFPTAPLSLEVEVGGYLPSGPRSLDSDLYVPSAPSSLERGRPWESAAVIPRPLFASHSHLPSTSLQSVSPEGFASETSTGATERRRNHHRSDHVPSDTNNNSNISNNNVASLAPELQAASNISRRNSSSSSIAQLHNTTSNTFGSNTDFNSRNITDTNIYSSEGHHIGSSSNEANSRSSTVSDESNRNSTLTDGSNRTSIISDLSTRNITSDESNRNSVASDGNINNGGNRNDAASDGSNRSSIAREEILNRNSVTSEANPVNNLNEVNNRNSATSEVSSRNSATSEVNNRNSATSERRSRSNNEGNSNRGGRGNRGRSRSERQSPRRDAFAGSGLEAERVRVQGGTWTHTHSGLMASLAVTVTTFNISRFAVLGARFGWPFVVQWLVVSAVLGLPLMTFHVTVGQYLGAGVVDMWRISPIFQGVGYSLVVAQALVGLYCCVPIAWLFIFFRDSFITHNNMFRWADCRLVNCSVFNNFTTIIIEGVPKYFNSQILQRGEGESSWLQELGSLKFDMAFNIALIWIITLIALSRGNQSYGKVCYIVFLLPLLCYLVVCLYLASWTKDDLYINDVTNFNEFFMNSRSWMAASREVFLVWGFHGAVLQQMAAHNKRGHALYRDTTILSIITSLVLVLAAVTGSSCVSGLLQNNLHYKPSSFENLENAQFLTETKVQQKMLLETFIQHLHMGNLSPQHLAEYMYHDNFYAGIRIRSPKIGNVKRTEVDDRSGYQSLRLATELFPALLAVNGAQQISPFWSSLFYLSLLLFGIAQQLAVWRTIVEAVIRINRERLHAWETFITFLCCLFGFSAALPMATGAGIHILYFLDYVVSCGWWLMIIQLVQIFALLFVRGKPYSGHDIVSELMGSNKQCRSLWLGPLTSFAWNIIVPVGLLVLSISSFKSGQYRDVFAWGSDNYWPVWVCQLASALQLFPILLVPLVGLVQTCRYLAATDDDLFERIQLLYRPTLRQRTSGNSSFLSVTEESDLDGLGGLRDGQEETVSPPTPRPYSDPPPKYTPPPSYSTATGVRFAKLLNQSLRRSMRRLRDTLRNGSEASARTDAEGTQQELECGQLNTTAARESTPYIPPPDYVTAVTECNRERSHSSTSSESPPQYSTLDPLRRQQALAALANASTSNTCIKADDETELPLPTAPGLNRNNSLRRSALRRSIVSGVRRSARRLAASLGVGAGEDGTTLVGSEAPVSHDGQPGREAEPSHPYAYTNFELASHSHA